MGRMSRSVQRTFCLCSSAGLVVRVGTILLISLLATVGREEEEGLTIRPLKQFLLITTTQCIQMVVGYLDIFVFEEFCFAF